MIWISLWISAAILTAVIAAAKNKSIVAWFFLGLLFGLFAAVAVAFSPAVTITPESANIGNAYRYRTEEEKPQADTGNLFNTIALNLGLLLLTGMLAGIAMVVFQ